MSKRKPTSTNSGFDQKELQEILESQERERAARDLRKEENERLIKAITKNRIEEGTLKAKTTAYTRRVYSYKDHVMRDAEERGLDPKEYREELLNSKRAHIVNCFRVWITKS